MPIKEPATPLPPLVDTAQLHLMDSDGLLFCPVRKQLYYLNTTASYIWCGLKEGLLQEQVSEAMASQFRISARHARQNVHEVLATWGSEAQPTVLSTPIAATSPSQQGSSEMKGKVTSHWPGGPETASHKRDVSGQPPAREISAWCNYRIGHMRFRVRYPSTDAEEIVRPALAHLAETHERYTTDSSFDIDIVEQNGRFSLCCDEAGHGEFISRREIIPLLHQLILTKAFKTSGCLAGFHAGAVCDKRGSLLLPAASGSGKSTLIAALVGSGLTYQTDELVLLMPDLTLCPLPVSLGLKKGSWPIFEAGMPAPGSISTHHQQDGTEIKYFGPHSPAALTSQPPLRALVFPKYQAATSSKLTPISSAKALYRLAQAGYAVTGELSPELVSTLVDWVGNHACYELQVGDLDTAVSAVRELLG